MPSAHRHDHLNTIPVSDLDDPALEPLLAPYRNQKDAWLRAQRDQSTGLGDGLFLAEGALVVTTLIDSPHEAVSILCTPARRDAMAPALARLPEGTPLLLAERPLLERIIGFDLHRGILAAGRRVAPPTADHLIATARTLVICEDIANHDNIGAIFRNTAALAQDPAILLSPRSCDPLYRKSLRVSMGHALRVPFATLEPWPEALDKLGGVMSLALTPDARAIPLQELRIAPGDRMALLLGAEGPGLTEDVTRRVSVLARIPQNPAVDSLNVATALAVTLSHLARP